MTIWVTLFQEHGRGDVLLLTPALRVLRQAYPRTRIVCRVNYPELLLHNPHVDSVVDGTRSKCRDAGVHRAVGDLWFHIDYRSRCVRGLDRHIVDVICQFCGVSSPSTIPTLVLTSTERHRGWKLVNDSFESRPQSVVAIHCRPSAVNREWPHLNWAELVRQFPNVGFIQVGGRDDDVVEGVANACGRWSLRETASAVAACDAVVAIDSWVHHAAAAVMTPAVVIFGSTAPEAFGHAMHSNLARKVDCGPCYRPALWAGDFIEDALQPGTKEPWICSQRACFDLITSDAVAAALRTALEQPLQLSASAAR